MWNSPEGGRQGAYYIHSLFSYFPQKLDIIAVVVVVPVAQEVIGVGKERRALRPCLNVEIEYVHRICLVTDSVDRFYFGSKRSYWEIRCY